jgi:mannitol-1-/sugar-/sorbitol-6-phosphatase
MTGWRCAAVLFDLDGVLVDSRRCIEAVWRRWAAGKRIDPEPFIRIAHGRRISETLRRIDPTLNVAAEAAALDRMEETETTGVLPVPGAAALLQSIPAARWAIVTSGSRRVASLRLGTVSLPIPDVFVTAEAVTRGKPAPDGYLDAADRLGVAPAECVVVEDSPPGVAASRAAGMRVIAVLSTHAAGDLAPADIRVHALGDLRVTPDPNGILLEWRSA